MKQLIVGSVFEVVVDHDEAAAVLRLCGSSELSLLSSVVELLSEHCAAGLVVSTVPLSRAEAMGLREFLSSLSEGRSAVPLSMDDRAPLYRLRRRVEAALSDR